MCDPETSSEATSPIQDGGGEPFSLKAPEGEPEQDRDVSFAVKGVLGDHGELCTPQLLLLDDPTVLIDVLLVGRSQSQEAHLPPEVGPAVGARARVPVFTYLALNAV